MPALDDPSGLLDRAFSAVLFDLDGTLIDSTRAVERAWARWARSWGIDPDSFDVVHGVPARTQLAELIAADDVELAFVALERMEMAELDGVVAQPGAVAALEALPDRRAAIVTSGTRPLAELRIRHTGLRPPAVLLTAEDTPVGKPDPAPYLRAAELLGFEPASCLVVEDAPAGLDAGRSAGCATLALTTTHPARQLIADAVIRDLTAVGFEVASSGIRVRMA